MPHLHDGQLPIPWGGRSPRAKAASLSGARVCAARSQAARLLIAYLTHGASTDRQQAERLGLPEARISARRSGLVERLLVAYVDDVPGPYGTRNTRWNLTAPGRSVAGDLARSL